MICFSSPSVNKASCCTSPLSHVNNSAFYRLFIRSYLQYKFCGLVVCTARSQFLHSPSKIGTVHPFLHLKSSNFASISWDKLCTNVCLPFHKIFCNAIMTAYWRSGKERAINRKNSIYQEWGRAKLNALLYIHG